MTGALEGKVVAITGAGRGIGRAIALDCAKQGACVVVNDIGTSLRADNEIADSGPAKAVVEEILAFGGSAIGNIADVADKEGARSIVEDAIHAFGRIDSVVCNAGNSRDGLFHKLSFEDWDSVINVHLNGSFYVARAAAPYFRAQESGNFVFMTSASGLVGNIAQSNYAAAKLGIVGLSRSIALDMKRFGVRSNAIAPFAWSRMTDSIPTLRRDQQVRAERLKATSAEDVAPLVSFLCSDAARDFTGQVLSSRRREISLFSASRPIRSLHNANGWDGESLENVLLPALRPNFIPLEVSADVFAWDPV